MPQPKYAARFENFFLNLRLNRAEFADMAEFTLAALHASGKYDALAETLAAELKTYRTVHAGQLSGEGVAATLTAKQALTDFKVYLKMVERKYIIPTYADESPDYLALLPEGRSGLAKTAKNKVEDAFTAFLDAMDARPVVFPEALRQQGRGSKDKPGILGNLHATLTAADKAKSARGTRKIDLHDGRKATCQVLFRIYATLLADFFDNPVKAAPFFDLSRAETGGGKKAKLPVV
jgi:hypothetical protein